ncbi:flagellar hook-associated protein FlgL [Lentibacillus saliphilus]|uniref:flagellar hook-associated protein FlgL n=1 Tax=Lentibacillus saliphilus TaxID=2737028 RepID=UPI001C3105E3|nr:flagellar hook-associated protein FlgL [Lentibacillus saliphilus]
MRVTQGMISNNMLRNLSNSYANLSTYLEQVSTGKKINRPSDDPVIAMKGINFRRQVTEVEQYKRNVGEVHNWMDNTDSALDKTTKALHKLRELAVQASNDTLDESERKNVMEEVEQIKEHLVDIANTKVNDKYIFNGVKTTDKPFNDDGTTTAEFNTDAVNIEVSKGINIQANINPSDVFSDDFFGRVDDFVDALGANDQDAINQSIGALDVNIENTINTRADLGARMNRLELIENRLGEQEVIAKKTMSDNEDIDYEKAITDLITQESLHRAALAAGSRIIQPTLLDFLR